MKSHQVGTWPQHLPFVLGVPTTNLYFNLQVSAARFPQKPVVIDERGALSYADLLAQVDSIAGFLEQKLGVKPSDRIMIYMQNCREFIAAYFAVMRICGVVVPVNPMNKRMELSHFRADSDAKVAFCSEDNADELRAMDESINLRTLIVTGSSGPGVRQTVEAGTADGPTIIAFDTAIEEHCTPSALQHRPDDLALILYSSGTTGFPKGCMHTHRSLMAGSVTVAHWMGMQSETVLLAALPFFHITGMLNLMNAPIYGSGTLVLLKRWNRDAAADLIAQHKVTHWTAMPTMVIDFLASPRLPEYDLRSVRRMGGGGAGMPQAVSERLKTMTGFDYLEGYGMSEITPALGNPAMHYKRQCLGIPLFNVDVRVVDPETLRELPAGEVGEIVITAPQLFSGYWRNEEATKQAMFELDGQRFFRSGDLGRVDEEGYFYIVDRLKRMVNASGFKVWPAEVEAMLHEHPAVKEACVIASRDGYRGETVKAVIVLRDKKGDVSAEDIIQWAKGRMAAYKYPRLVEFVDELPKSPTGKIAWRSLQEAEMARQSGAD